MSDMGSSVSSQGTQVQNITVIPNNLEIIMEKISITDKKKKREPKSEKKKLYRKKKVRSLTEANLSKFNKIQEPIASGSRLSRPIKRDDQIFLSRSSTPSYNCYHCEHFHKKACCAYLDDEAEDVMLYAAWKIDADYPFIMEKKSDEKLDDLIHGMVTPKHFPPGFTLTSKKANEEMMKNFKPIPIVYMRKVFYPVPLWKKIFYPVVAKASMMNYCNPYGFVQSGLSPNQYEPKHMEYFAPYVYKRGDIVPPEPAAPRSAVNIAAMNYLNSKPKTSQKHHVGLNNLYPTFNPQYYY